MMFKKDLIDKILTGTKTMTSRDKPLYKVGAVTNLMANKDYSKATGKYIKITAVYEKALGRFWTHEIGFEFENNPPHQNLQLTFKFSGSVYSKASKISVKT